MGLRRDRAVGCYNLKASHARLAPVICHWHWGKITFQRGFSSRFYFPGRIFCTMPFKKKIAKSHGAYFITFTCCEWLPLIEMTNSYDLVYKWFDYLRSCGHHIIGYVIMPNHLHALIAFRNTDQSINKMVGNGKRFIAYGIVSRLEQQDHETLLSKLNLLVTGSDRKRNKRHEVWEDFFDWKECHSINMILQKLNYIHNNPCRGKWNLASSPEEYYYSSAMYYPTGKHTSYPVTHYMFLDDLDLSKPLTTYG
jgi:REP element-mobilizing transposase RayT